MKTLEHQLKVILDRRHEILVEEFQKALNVAFDHGYNCADACRFAFCATHPIVKDNAAKVMTQVLVKILEV